jgi:hypothetical protein
MAEDQMLGHTLAHKIKVVQDLRRRAVDVASDDSLIVVHLHPYTSAPGGSGESML